ncbi:MAG: aminodeoxychorismate/anthranilate synthase component II [Firmicutes bacterium]|nr:aminodeoxychorismate/anthranilate synthase component II [Bacillota bacterium]
MILIIDNYDSFVYNLAQYLGELGAEVEVARNDALDLEAMERKAPSHLVISPGPGRPEEAGVSMAAIRHFAGLIPILGVCLGHQAIGAAFGGAVVRYRPIHGKTSLITHDGEGLFAGLPNPLRATRYHSLVVDGGSLPADLRVTPTTEPGLVMGLAHRRWPIFGVQFHPESILTEAGHEMLRNFLRAGAVASSPAGPG